MVKRVSGRLSAAIEQAVTTGDVGGVVSERYVPTWSTWMPPDSA